MVRKGLEGKSHRLRALQEIFEEGYVKIKKKKEEKRKSGMEGECPINTKKGERRTQQMPEVNTKKKSSFMSFGVSKIKPLVSSKRLN